MKNNLMYLLVVLVSIPTLVKSQTVLYAIEHDSIANLNFFVSVDPSNGTINQIDTISGSQYYDINNATLNPISDVYVVVGSNNIIYTIDINTGAIIANPNLSAEIHELQYDNINDKYYALEVETISSSSSTINDTTQQNSNSIKIFFVEVNTTTGIASRLDSITGLESVQVGSSVINNSSNEYSFIGNRNIIYTIDMSTGNLLNSAALTTQINELQINLSDDIMYAIETETMSFSSGGSSSTTGPITTNAINYLVSVNNTTGLVTRIDSISGLKGFKSCTSNIDTLNNYFEVIDKNGKLLSIDLLSALVINNPQLNGNIINTTIKTTSGGGSRIINNNNQGLIYSYPNPAKNFINVVVDKIPAEMEMYDYRGQMVKQKTLNQYNNRISVNDLKEGLFIMKVNSTTTKTTEKILIQ